MKLIDRAGIILVGYFITKPAPPFEPLGWSSLNCIKIWGVTEVNELCSTLIIAGWLLIVFQNKSPIYSYGSNIRKEVISLSKRKIRDVLLAVITAIFMVVDSVHHKDSETEIE